MDIPWNTDTLFLSDQGNHFMKWWTTIISNEIHHSRQATSLIHIMTKQTSSKTRLPYELTWNTPKQDQSQTKTIPKMNHMPTKNQTTFPTHRFNKKNLASYYKIVASMFQSHCTNPKPTPNTEFDSTPKKKLTNLPKKRNPPQKNQLWNKRKVATTNLHYNQCMIFAIFFRLLYTKTSLANRYSTHHWTQT